MAFFNPQYIQYNPNAAIIQGAGAVGKSLYDVYKDNVARQQAYNLQQETNRANLARESEISRHNLVTEANQTKGLDIQQQGVNNTANHYANMQKHYNDNLAFQKEKQKADMLYKNKELAFRQNEVKNRADKDANNNVAKFLATHAEYNAIADIYAKSGKPLSLPAGFEKLPPNAQMAIMQGQINTYGGAGLSRADKAIGINLDNAATDKELMATYEARKNDPYFASLFGALNDKGEIDQKALYDNFNTEANLSGKKLSEKLKLVDNDKNLFRQKFTSDPSIQQIASMSEKLARIKELNQNAEVDSFQGWGDNVVDALKRGLGVGTQGKDDTLNTALVNELLTAYTRANMTGKADSERKELIAPFDSILEHNWFMDNKAKSQFYTLATSTISPMIAKLEKEKENVSGQFQKNYIQSEIDKAKTLLKGLKEYSGVNDDEPLRNTIPKTNATQTLPKLQGHTNF